MNKLTELEKKCRRIERKGMHSVNDFPFLFTRVEFNETRHVPCHTTNPIDAFLKETLDTVLFTLTKQEAVVLKMRYNNSMTLAAIAACLKITPERIRQVEAKALRKLRHPLRAELLEPFMLDFSPNMKLSTIEP